MTHATAGLAPSGARGGGRTVVGLVIGTGTRGTAAVGAGVTRGVILAGIATGLAPRTARSGRGAVVGLVVGAGTGGTAAVGGGTSGRVVLARVTTGLTPRSTTVAREVAAGLIRTARAGVTGSIDRSGAVHLVVSRSTSGPGGATGITRASGISVSSTRATTVVVRAGRDGARRTISTGTVLSRRACEVGFGPRTTIGPAGTGTGPVGAAPRQGAKITRVITRTRITRRVRGATRNFTTVSAIGGGFTITHESRWTGAAETAYAVGARGAINATATRVTIGNNSHIVDEPTIFLNTAI